MKIPRPRNFKQTVCFSLIIFEIFSHKLFLFSQCTDAKIAINLTNCEKYADKQDFI